MADNVICVSGNLTSEPSLRFTAGGQAVCSVGIAVNRRWQKDGSWEEEVTFLTIQAWAKLAENLAASCVKGTRVIVSGRINVRQYDDKDGNKRTSVEIVADDIGPSLKWATAEIERVTREHSDGAGTQKPPRNRSEPVYGDDEPFASLGQRFDGYRNMECI